jgi:hypothetical protein
MGFASNVFPRAALLLVSCHLGLPVLIGAHAGGMANPIPTSIRCKPFKDERQLGGVFAMESGFFRLPEHVAFNQGGRLELEYATASGIPGNERLMVTLNGFRIHHGALKSGVAEGRIEIPISEHRLRSGWNQIAIQLFGGIPEKEKQARHPPSAWFRLKPATAVEIYYDRLPVFPELQRFPESLTEEALLRGSASFDPESVAQAWLHLVIPNAPSAAHLRALVTAAARLGQPGYLRPGDWKLSRLENWPDFKNHTCGLLIATVEQLEAFPIPKKIKSVLSGLQSGQGLIAEFIEADEVSSKSPHIPGGGRWILLAGADEAGIDKAATVLGSDHAMETLSDNPTVISQEAMIPPWLEEKAFPTGQFRTLKSEKIRPIRFGGDFSSEQSISIPLPPGARLVDGHFLPRFNIHRAEFAQSQVEFWLNGLFVARHLLESLGGRAITFPKGMLGADPCALSIRILPPAGALGDSFDSRRTWATLEDESGWSVRAEPLPVQGMEIVTCGNF